MFEQVVLDKETQSAGLRWSFRKTVRSWFLQKRRKLLPWKNDLAKQLCMLVTVERSHGRSLLFFQLSLNRALTCRGGPDGTGAAKKLTPGSISGAQP